MAQLRSRPTRHGSDNITRNLPGIDFRMKRRLMHRELKRRAFASTAHFSRLKPSGYEKRKSRVDFSSFASPSTSPLHADRSALPRAAPRSRSLRSSPFAHMLARTAPVPHHLHAAAFVHARHPLVSHKAPRSVLQHLWRRGNGTSNPLETIEPKHHFEQGSLMNCVQELFTERHGIVERISS